MSIRERIVINEHHDEHHVLMMIATMLPIETVWVEQHGITIGRVQRAAAYSWYIFPYDAFGNSQVDLRTEYTIAEKCVSAIRRLFLEPAGVED